MTRDERSPELRAVAPMIVLDGSGQLVGPCTFVTNGVKTIAFSSAALLRSAPDPLGIALTFDGARTIEVASWSMGRRSGLGIIEIAGEFPADVIGIRPLQIGNVLAHPDARGAPSALVTIEAVDGGYVRRVVPVHVDNIDGGGMADEILKRLATPDNAEDSVVMIEGAPLFAWMPPEPRLGRPAQLVAAALGLDYDPKTFQPRKLPALAQLVSLEDLGRALPHRVVAKEDEGHALTAAAGEIKDYFDDDE